MRNWNATRRENEARGERDWTRKTRPAGALDARIRGPRGGSRIPRSSWRVGHENEALGQRVPARFSVFQHACSFFWARCMAWFIFGERKMVFKKHRVFAQGMLAEGGRRSERARRKKMTRVGSGSVSCRKGDFGMLLPGAVVPRKRRADDDRGWSKAGAEAGASTKSRPGVCARREKRRRDDGRLEQPLGYEVGGCGAMFSSDLSSSERRW